MKHLLLILISTCFMFSHSLFAADSGTEAASATECNDCKFKQSSTTNHITCKPGCSSNPEADPIKYCPAKCQSFRSNNGKSGSSSGSSTDGLSSGSNSDGQQ